MKIKAKNFSKLNPHVASRVLTIISERINYGWDFRELYPEFYHMNNKKLSPIFTQGTQELLFDFFNRMFSLQPLSIDEFMVLSASLEDANSVTLDKHIENYSNYNLELQLSWFKAIIDLVVEICLTDCTFMADRYSKAVVEYSKTNLNVINFLYLAKYNYEI